MQLRSQAISAGETFYAFKRLPIEIQQMIWCFTLQPRFVEIKYKNASKAYFSRAALPSAFYVCHDSRNAVIPCYPRFFSSEAHRPTILFNPSLDTVYLDDFNEDRLLCFFKNLGARELALLENIAISEVAGMEFGQGHDTELYQYWEKVGDRMKHLPRLRNLLVVRDVSKYVDWYNYFRVDDYFGLGEELDEWCDEYCWYRPCDHRCVELFDQFPGELTRRFKLTEDNLPAIFNQSQHLKALLGRITVSDGQDQAAEDDLPVDSELTLHREWLQKRTRAVWGWRRAEYPAMVL